MARILSFCVEGLAGRDKPCSGSLNPDVNVFYGVNGSGKTTLLKIFQSALSTEESILSGLPFKTAEIEIYLNRYDMVFKRRYKSEELKKREKPKNSLYARAALALAGDVNLPKWTSEPEEPGGGLTSYSDGFLPITRLYRTVRRGPLGAGTISEEELDARFAESVKRLWVDDCSEISTEISKAQATGLANILHLVLSGEEPESGGDSVASTEEAYKRVSDFLSRQAGFEDVLDSAGVVCEKI